MGRDNVDKLLLAGRPAAIRYSTFLCLLLMARVASDKDPRYWAGHAWIALGMGYKAGDEAGLRAVRRHTRDLERAGYIATIADHPGARTTYQLTIPGYPQ